MSPNSPHQNQAACSKSFDDGHASGSVGDNSASSVRAQIFNSSGVKVGAEFLVNTTTIDDQISPCLSSLSNGNFVAIWSDLSQTGGDVSSRAVRAQIFTASGIKVGPEFLANTTTIGMQSDPTVIELLNGNFVVSWFGYSNVGGDGRVFTSQYQIFDPMGGRIGTEALLTKTSVGEVGKPEMTPLASGGFVVTWSVNTGLSNEIRAQLVEADGRKSGAEFGINTTNDGYEIVPSICSINDGRFVVVWMDVRPTSDAEVRGQVFNAKGTKSGLEFIVNTTTASYQGYPVAAALPDGRFIVSWTETRQLINGSSSDEVRAQIFDPRFQAVELLGTLAGDYFVGTQYDDWLSGKEGSDTLNGSTGEDLLFGGAQGMTASMVALVPTGIAVV